MPAVWEHPRWNWTLEVYLMPLFPVCLHVRMPTGLSLQHRADGSHRILLTSEKSSEPRVYLFIGCAFVSMFAGPHMCMHLGYCVKPSVANPLICWTLEITAVICQLGHGGLEGTCTSLRTHIIVFLLNLQRDFSLIKASHHRMNLRNRTKVRANVQHTTDNVREQMLAAGKQLSHHRHMWIGEYLGLQRKHTKWKINLDCVSRLKAQT